MYEIVSMGSFDAFNLWVVKKALNYRRDARCTPGQGGQDSKNNGVTIAKMNNEAYFLMVGGRP